MSRRVPVKARATRCGRYPPAPACGPVRTYARRMADPTTDATPDDELLNRVTWKIPNALALVGSRAGDERNAMTTSWITQLSMEPVLIGVGVDNGPVTHRLVNTCGAFPG